MISKEAIAIYLSGLLQGLVLVVFPAISTILTSPEEFNFSNSYYGSLFIPQAVISIIASLFNPRFVRSLGAKFVLNLGLKANFFAMILLGLSAFSVHSLPVAYAMLLMATACVGLGFGLVVPTLNMMAALLYPHKVDSMLLLLNALLGLGTALAPIFVTLFVALGYWWGLPLLLTVMLFFLILYNERLHLPGGKIDITTKSSATLHIPLGFWIFVTFAFLYGIIETLSANWVSIYMKEHVHASIKIQSMALAAFWGMVTFGRLLFSFIVKFVSQEYIFQASPFIAMLAFIFISSLVPEADYRGVAFFGLAGLGCASLLPLTISFGSKKFPSIVSSVPGMIISFYLLGYGVAAFGVGPLQEIAHISLQSIYFLGAVVAFILGVLAIIIH